MEKKIYRNIVVNPDVMVGKPVIKGTRIPVALIVKLLADGMTPREILAEYPRLKKEDIKTVLEYVALVINNEEIVLKE